MTKIKNLAEIKTIRQHDVFLSLAGGAVRSSKDIYFNGNTFEVFHSISGTMETLTEKKLLESNIGIALTNGCLYRY